MPGLLGPLISFVKNHPVIGGSLVIAFGILLIDLSLDGARRYRLYEGAGEIEAQVLSITKASSVPPRFDLILSWPNGSSVARSIIRTGPRPVETLKEGDPVEILVSKVNGDVILASQRPEDAPLGFGRFEATPVIFFGIGMSLVGLLLALFGGRLQDMS